MRGQLIRFAKELEEENNAAFDLWTWLPSYKEAKNHHGDYADEFQPPMAEILKEASIYISVKCSPSEEQLKTIEFFKCPCGEDHYEKS